ncbi:MAG: hypothetical protein FJ247_01790 [Nitrospira sp.]|nr:hypothetical protein [Nitrospira sp.]
MARTRGNTALQLEPGQRNHKPARHITTRESQILKRVARGRTNREIAASLDISVRTVEVHRFNMMRRLNVRNVAQLLRQSMQLGLLPRDFGPR